MGIVVAVHHLHLDQQFAVKLMLPDMLGSEEAVARFVREARAAAKIKSDHVVRVFDVDSLANGAPYLVMELLEGKDVANILRDEGPFSVENAVDLVVETCEVVAAAHALGIVHRDLKPGNLFATRGPDGRTSIKVLDFGISKVTTPGTAPGLDMTKTAASMGSPLYMSPEQTQSARDVDGRTDIWAIGVILFELLVGRVPFVGKTPIEVALKIVGHAAPRPRDFRPEIPAPLESVVLKCLEKDPAARYANVGALADALSPWASAYAKPSLERIARSPVPAERAAPPSPVAVAVPINASVEGTKTALPPVEIVTVASPSVSPSPAESSSTRTSPAWGTTTPPHKGRRVGASVALAAGAALVGGVGYFALRAPSPSSTAGSSALATTAMESPSSAAPTGAGPSAAVASAANAPVETEAVPRPATTEPTAPDQPAAGTTSAMAAAKREEARPEMVRRVRPSKASGAGATGSAAGSTAPATPPGSAAAGVSSAPRPGVWQDRK
jgi:serine/threonine-protein kinase